MPADTAAAIAAELSRTGFARRNADQIAADLADHGLRDWDNFAASWNDLGTDRYMADGGRYRQRRHAVFQRDAGGLIRQPHRAHYQSRDYNSLNGGIARWFEPILAATAAHPALLAALDLAHRCFDTAHPNPSWEVELHQFRITAVTGAAGRPTPEGMHRDGVDYVMVMLIKRENVQSGVTIIADDDGAPLGSFTLTAPADATFLDDHRVYHAVTPIEPIDPDRPAWRDVLVATFRGV